MRRFSANDGALWDAVIGHESWGTFVVLFTPVAGGDARKSDARRGDRTRRGDRARRKKRR